MAPLSKEEKSKIADTVHQALSDTPYACSQLMELGNGTTNLVFRGQLLRPRTYTRAEGETVTITTVVVKHSLEHAAFNKGLPIAASRAICEAHILGALNHLSFSLLDATTPRIYGFVHTAKIQVLEDLGAVCDLNSALRLSNPTLTLTVETAMLIARSAGSWLRTFHEWTADPLNKFDRVCRVGHNESMRKLKYHLTYGAYIGMLESSFPELVVSNRLLLQQVKETAMREFEMTVNDLIFDKDWGLIHGDFCPRNILLGSEITDDHLGTWRKLYVIDWEFVQFGHRAYDVGQMIGGLYERMLFAGTSNSLPALHGFVQGYGDIDDELAFRIAVHAGVHLICRAFEGGRNSPPQASPSAIKSAMQLGVTWIVRGCARDFGFFSYTPLATFFSRTRP